MAEAGSTVIKKNADISGRGFDPPKDEHQSRHWIDRTIESFFKLHRQISKILPYPIISMFVSIFTLVLAIIEIIVFLPLTFVSLCTKEKEAGVLGLLFGIGFFFYAIGNVATLGLLVFVAEWMIREVKS